MMPKFLLAAVLLFGSSHVMAFCEGFSLASFCSQSDPVEPAENWCDSLIGTGGFIERASLSGVTDTSTATVDKISGRCNLWHDYGGTQGDTVVQFYNFNVAFQSCRGGAKQGSNNNCIRVCDEPLDADGKCPPPPKKKECLKGSDPIHYLTGDKLFEEVDYESKGINTLSYIRFYDSHNNKYRLTQSGWLSPDKDLSYFESNASYYLEAPTNKMSEAITVNKFIVQKEVTYTGNFEDETLIVNAISEQSKPLGAINSTWRNNYDKSLFFSKPDKSELRLSRPNGDELAFIFQSTFYVPLNPHEQTNEKVVFADDEYTYFLSDLSVEVYDEHGRLLSIKNKNNYLQTMTYNQDGLLSQVSDSLNRSLSLTYDTARRVSSMTTPDGHVFQYEYEGNTDNIKRVIYPSVNTEFNVREYVYGDLRFPNAITQIKDNGVVFGDYVYDSAGKATYSSRASGAGGYSVDSSEPGQTTVTNALGKQTIYYFDSENNLTQVDGVPSANCIGDSRSFTYDSNNFKISETDKNGNLTTYARDAFGRETSRTEAVGTPQARTITTEWHPTLNLITKITEPDSTTTYQYDANGLLLNKTISPNTGL